MEIVQPPLRRVSGREDERGDALLAGTEEWRKILPFEGSRRTGMGWWDLQQMEVSEKEDGSAVSRVEEGVYSPYPNWWPGFGRHRIGALMEDATVKFEEGTRWKL